MLPKKAKADLAKVSIPPLCFLGNKSNKFKGGTRVKRRALLKC